MSYGLRGIDKKSMKTHVKSVDDMAVDCTWNEESFGTRIEGGGKTGQVVFDRVLHYYILTCQMLALWPITDFDQNVKKV